MNTGIKLKKEIEVCDLHADRLQMAIKHIKSIFPLTPEKLATLDIGDLGVIELMTNRFAKLQDTIGQKIFPLFLDILGELQQSDSFIDRLNKLEKLEILQNVDFWKHMRDVRNETAHDYPEDAGKVISKIMDCFQASLKLLSFWEDLKQTMIKRIGSKAD